MRLRRLDLENFRAFRDAEINLPGAGLVLVAGPNNAGKSALLSAVDVLASDPGDLVSVRHGSADSPARLTATFDLDLTERAAILENATGGQWLLDGEVFDRLQFRFEQWQDRDLLLREVYGTWPGHGLQPVVIMHPRVRGNNEEYRYAVIRSFQSDNGPGGVLASPDNGRELLEVTGTTSSGQSGLDGYLGSQPNLAPLMAPLVAWRSRYYHFRALRIGTQRTQHLASDEKLRPTGDNLAAVLHFLLTDRMHLFYEVGDLIRQVVPGIGTLGVRTGGNQMRVVFESDAGELNLKDLGTGVEQLLMTIVVGLTEQAPFTLLIEEPETNLNPAAQRALSGLLQRWASERLIVAATHSTVMLDWSPAGDRLWLVTREDDASTVQPVNADPLPLLNALGIRLSDVLSADRVLVVEGSSDEDILQAWFPEVLRHPRVAVLGGHGGDNAQHADQLAEWLAGTDRIGVRKVLYLRDRDELAPAMLQRLTDSTSVHVLGRREIENYLLDPAAVAAVIQPLVPVGMTAPDAAAVAAAMNTVAEALRQKIVINRVAQRVIPPQPLMNTRLRQKLAAAGVNLAAFSEAISARLMEPVELKTQIAAAWQEAETDVNAHVDEKLLEIAPGEEILITLFAQFAKRRFDKRMHGPMIAAAMERPAELVQLFDSFMVD